ncbi:energy-coupling factor transporter ATP-binding protein EcfA2 [Paraburkholderia sp. RAU6.4a]|uniref:AAA family ATPase n=1 Tax=Paraburkholderia sp. RAU6.4a TaxID=2991067 RepID=UPI003D252499
MASILAEYQRFLASLAISPASENVRRMANLVLANLDHLAEVGATRRARSVRLAPIAVNHLLTTAAEIQPEALPDAHEQLMGRLHELRVGPFRGFMREETFDLSRDITLVYGANGTGKSSFCEALETAMLGFISEAKIKRVDHRVYCNNARLRRHAIPVLTSRAGEADLAVVASNEDAYRFCFIEKNRLDDFARIAARTPGDQRQLIATLFGVDQFSEFVRGFNPDLDENLNLSGLKGLMLAGRRTQLAASEQLIRANPEKLAQLDRDELALAERIWTGKSFAEVCDWLFGNAQTQGQLPYVQGLLNAAPPQIHGITQANLAALLAETYRIDALLRNARDQLAARAGDVSYTQLYNAVLQLSNGATSCPACGTDLGQVAQNPFDRARAGLQQLAELAAIQRQEEQHSQALNGALQNLLMSMSGAIRAVAVVSPEELRAANLPVLPPVSAGQWLQPWVENNQQGWRTLLGLVASIEHRDAENQRVLAQRHELAQERDRLDGYRSDIERCRTIRATSLEAVLQAQGEVAQFEVANRELVAEVAAEANVIAHHRVIKDSYDGFLAALKQYLDGLPALLLQGLGQRARDLYNSFNRDDPPADLLHALWLPLAENGKIEIEFAAEPGVRYDALVILSEGHIKCLGLAILLAKNIEQSCPVVIFDDVVNAIDDEHRNGIWRTFFEDNLLDGKQVILTSHAEEFLHRIQQELGAQRAQMIKVYKFLPHEGEHHLRVDADPPTKNYVLLAQASLAADEKRDALRHSRPAIESLTDRLWTRLGSRLELKLAGPRAKWELNNKCMKLRGALARLPNPHPAIPAVVAALDDLLGINGGSIEWGYLNSGTHDAQRDNEFDRAAVRRIVGATAALDAGLIQLQQGR